MAGYDLLHGSLALKTGEFFLHRTEPADGTSIAYTYAMLNTRTDMPTLLFTPFDLTSSFVFPDGARPERNVLK